MISHIVLLRARSMYVMVLDVILMTVCNFPATPRLLLFIFFIGHQFEVTIPTLVPSILSGITNSITSLKTPPRNKQDLLDFAVAGPLAGMVTSLFVLSYGLVLTATADATAFQGFPALPLIILRSSSLGGGLVDIFIGNGVLNVPASAEGAQALASTLIPLHPLAVAGYFSLLVNALAMIPVGSKYGTGLLLIMLHFRYFISSYTLTPLDLQLFFDDYSLMMPGTDGGRVSMALFGRSGSQVVTFLSLAFMFVLGLSQSDLLLFYFGFVVFFQSELEIPCRNEVDDVGFSRVLLASFAYFLMLLTLIPM